MTLFATATDLQLRLQAANAADEGDEVLSRGRTVRDSIASAATRLEAVQTYRVAIGRAEAPPLDAREIRQAIGRFQGALKASGPRAVQQQWAATLLDVLTVQARRAANWVKSTWRENFSSAEELLKRADSRDLHGSPANRTKVRRLASTIAVIRNTDPIEEQAVLEGRLKVEGLNACLARVDDFVGELRAAIAAIDQEQAAMTPEVRSAIERAASDCGLPLGEVTPELLAALQSAGVLDDLVVRRL